MRRNAANWLEVADRVVRYRRDLLTGPQMENLLGAASLVRLRLKEDADAGRLKLAIEGLERELRDTGGRIYPATSLVENVEFFLVAAIVVLGLRAYFVQPFKIPTNSMWPSYYGMKAEVYPPGQEPGLMTRAARLLTLGATYHRVVAPADGEVMLAVYAGYAAPAVSEEPGRSLLIFPSVSRTYTLSVQGYPVHFDVPTDFDPRHEVLKQSFFPNAPGSFGTALIEAREKSGPWESSMLALQSGGHRREVRVEWVPTGRRVHRGDTILSFDILTGDLLFVDRMSYNFVRPKVGSGFVFRTGNIEALQRDEGDQYFVKRLAGVPGDVLEIREPVLYRNGRPADGSPAYGRNARREGKYPGFTNTPDGLLSLGGKVKVPPHSFFALGDNSPDSRDSRYWGFVPEKDVAGRPLFIYYPLTSRWGPAD